MDKETIDKYQERYKTLPANELAAVCLGFRWTRPIISGIRHSRPDIEFDEIFNEAVVAVLEHREKALEARDFLAYLGKRVGRAVSRMAGPRMKYSKYPENLEDKRVTLESNPFEVLGDKNLEAEFYKPSLLALRAKNEGVSTPALYKRRARYLSTLRGNPKIQEIASSIGL